jgi:methionyl-tRNA synthetase
MFVDPFDCDQKQPSTQETNYVEFSDLQKIDIRVGVILTAEDIPNKDNLVKLEVDLGELGVRTIVAGIKKQYHIQNLVRYPTNSVLVVTNLKPRKIGGVMSNGMLLAALDSSNTLNLATCRTLIAGTKVS